MQAKVEVELVISPDGFFLGRRVLAITTLAARRAIPAVYPVREFAAAGGLMSYRQPS